ncbi:MAG: VWA domain-containing protein, partial [Pyrinomonadaceae bacterium]
IHIDTSLVNLNVSVFSRDPLRLVGPLRQEDFRILENGEAQEIEFFASAETPFDLLLLIDLSGSTSDKLKLVRNTALKFVAATRPTDRIGIITFASAPELVSPLTLDREQLKKSIKHIDRPVGGTNFWDSLRFVIESVMSQTIGLRRSAVIVMTDGVDNALPDVRGDGSHTSFDALLEIIKQSESIVIPIYLDTEAEEVKRHRTPASAYVIARQQLSQIADASGSLVYRARKLEDLNGVYEQVIRDLGTVYSIGYHPAQHTRDGTWRTVSVELVGRPELAARTKRGYYAK